MDNIIQIGAGAIMIVALILSGMNKKESFGSDEIPSMHSMPKNEAQPGSGLPLFMNFYPRFGSDFKLFDYVQKLKLNNTNPMWNGVYKNTSSRNLTESKKLSPVIIVPGLGACPIFARWNKSSGAQMESPDRTGNFQMSDSWSCKQVQDSWVKIWPPDLDGLSSYCWANNTRVVPSKGSIVNTSGINTVNQEFGSIDFANEDYMSSLIEALEAFGYQKGINLFCANYDFRKIGDPDEMNDFCSSFTKLIEHNCALQENPAIIIGHDLGSVIANYFLVSSVKDWKNRFIGKFISISGAFGGCPKALRTILSGASTPGNSANFNSAIKASCGLSLMLPDPSVYGDNPLVHYNQTLYSSKDIPKLLSMVSKDAMETMNVCKSIKNTSMKAPGVETHILGGSDVNTESSYKYNLSLVNEPDKNVPFYRMELPFNQKFNYNDYFQGDGTIPKFALEYPIWWAKSQKEPVYYQFFAGAEHTKILSTLDLIQYIINACET